MAKNFFKKHFNLYDDKVGRMREHEGLVTTQINDSDFMTPNGTVATGDERMLSFAFENLMNEHVTFLKCDPIKDGADKIDCPVGKIVFVPHAYYNVCCMSGKPITGRLYYGEEMHKKINLKKSY